MIARGDLVLVLNCGSSSIKFAVYDGGVDPLPRRALWNGKVQGIGGPAPAAYLADLDLPGGRGLTMGVYRTISDLGMVMGPILLGAVSDRFSFSSALWLNGVLFVVAGVSFGLLAAETAGPSREKRARESIAAG